jgi:polyhydroxyalkanoate depolymerase
MLYSLFEAQHAALAPLRYLAEFSHGWLAHPFSPFSYSPFARRLAAGNDLFLRLTQRYEKPEWAIEEARIEVALERPFCKLIHFSQEKRKPHKVLVVAPLSGHHATLVRDTVRSLLVSGTTGSSADGAGAKSSIRACATLAAPTARSATLPRLAPRARPLCAAGGGRKAR